MMSLDLRPYGINATVNLEGNVVDAVVANSGTTLFFFEERHDCEAGIQSCLRMARRLIDTGIVQVVCVEGYPAGVEEGVESQGVAGLVEALKRAQVGEDDLITSINGFALALHALRPAAKILSIEDPDAYKRAEDAWRKQREGRLARTNDALLRECGGHLEVIKQFDKSKMSEIVNKVCRESLADMENALRQEVQDPRDCFFVKNIPLCAPPTKAGSAAIVNMGKSHHDPVISALRKMGGYSILRIRPDGLREFEEELAHDPRYQAIRRILNGKHPLGQV